MSTPTASGSGAQRIFAVIDPDNTISEVHDETDAVNNNKAYAYIDIAAVVYVDPGLAAHRAYEILTHSDGALQQGRTTATSAAVMESSVYVPLGNLAETMCFELNPQVAAQPGVAGYLIEVAAYVGDAL